MPEVESGYLVGALLFIASLVASVAVIAVVVVRIPPDWFIRTHSTFLEGHSPSVILLGRVGKNLLGVALLALGLVMALPGVPGQGILTMLLGLMLTDLPGKHKLIRRVVARREVHTAVDRLRARYGKPPIITEPPPDSPA